MTSVVGWCWAEDAGLKDRNVPEARGVPGIPDVPDAPERAGGLSHVPGAPGRAWSNGRAGNMVTHMVGLSLGTRGQLCLAPHRLASLAQLRCGDAGKCVTAGGARPLPPTPSRK